METFRLEALGTREDRITIGGLKVAAGPFATRGETSSPKTTLESKPFRLWRLITEALDKPARKVMEVGLADMVKSFTLRVTVVE